MKCWLILVLVSQVVVAEGFFRERLKKRFLEKLESEPAIAASTDVQSKIEKSGSYIFKFTHGNIDRFYKIYVPASYNFKKPTPVIFAFHGGGGDMSVQSSDEHYKLISKSEKEGFIVVFPNGLSPYKSGRLATWNAGNCCGDARDKNIDDVGFVKEIVKKVSGQLNIDAAQIFATGMSNGAMMSYRLACEAGDIFKAIAAVAGTDGTKECHPSKNISVLHIHAKDDDRVIFTGGAGKAFRDESKVANFTSVPATIEKWKKSNGCEGEPKKILEKKGAYCELYSPCKNGSKVQLCVTDTGGHSWPGGKKVIGGQAGSTAISANDVMWDFFTSK